MIMTDRDSKLPQLKGANKRTSAVVNKAVSGQLKAYYDEIAAQQVPARFIELLDRLDEQET